MINSKDTKIIKRQVMSAIIQAMNERDLYDNFPIEEVKKIVERAFNIVIREMRIGGI